ncbi:MAG: sigma-54-dependent Fis family transcriptional regulator [Mesorhizobium sp.]|uniref:sigma-54-dependent Fis family transcriptional regulator n=1 Tax=Mesorhizobium sp. TaxID=1871066 RepID=UPI000FE90A4D|nr:sigma-54-dependent Fis family transcriptional regulator [Mesorhizobium sp.]RWD59354.1 MAG: sigma-54-dependent Fis family transcriptional regulator [Mesorhizobium sp.]RWE42531.1 MAG: sigma-54-dependent Fis family transcriptional regulator [Mesorhizobium sp.]
MKRGIDTNQMKTGALSARAPMAAGQLALDATDYDERATMRAWENFLSDAPKGARDPVQVRSLIHDSWYRSATGGINAQGVEAPLNSNRDEIEYLTRANAELLAAARRPFASLGPLLEGTGAMLVLADSDGVLIEAIGDKKTLHDGMDIHLAIGGKWNEGAVGTNGIGTALWTGEPIFVHAAEHFCAGIKSWTCAGAPIRDPLDGKIIGVVDLSGYSPIFRPHNTALVAATARQIEKALAEQQQEQRTRLLEAFISSAPGYRGKDGLVIVDHRGRAIFCNNVPNGETTEMKNGPIEPGRGRWLMNLPASGSDSDLAKALPAHLRSCHITPLKLDGNLSGAALVFPAAPVVSGVTVISRETNNPLQAATSMIVGESEKLLAAIDVASRVARSRVTSLLIEGETGVGKELFARLVHAGSRRADNDPFVALNCGAVTKELFGSELFGHVAGAFTGASREGKAGVFEQANGGVLSLDEVGELPLEIQPFLLRVLEERVVHRIGDSRGRPVDVRLVASTNRDLKQEVAAGRFRSDLYYRIGAVSIRVPALRERGEDVLLLVEHFNRQIAGKTGNDPLEFSNDALDALLAYRWPGNVRELKNLMERLHILASNGTISLQDLPWEITVANRNGSTSHNDDPAAMLEAPVCTFEDGERQAIRNALAAENGNLSRVAQRLGISRPTLYRKLEQYGIRRGFV